MLRVQMTRRGVAILATLALATPQAHATIKTADMLPNASNVVLPAALNNLGIGRTYVYGANHGMVCDATADDTAALQNAINAAQVLAYPVTSNGGGVLVLPAGFCKVTGEVTVIRGLTVVGAGTGSDGGAGNSGGTVVRTNSTTADVFTVTADEAVTFDNFTIDTTATKTAGAGIRATGASGATANVGSKITRMRIAGMWDGVYFGNAFGWKLTNSRIVDSRHNSFTLAASDTFADGTGGGKQISNTAFYNLNTAAICNAGVELQGGGVISIADSQFLGCSYNLLVNLLHGPSGGALVHGNSMEEASVATIAVTQGAAAKEYGNLVITGNELGNVTVATLPQGNFYVGTGTPNTAPKWVRNIVFANNAANNTVAVPGGLVQINDGTEITLGGNVLNGNGVATTTGMSVGSAATNVTIEPSNQFARLAGGSFGAMYWPAVNAGLSPGPNLLVNPGMRIDPVSEGATTTVVTGANYCAESWQSQGSYTNGQAATCQRSTANPPPDGTHSALVTVTASGATGASDYVRLFQKVEAGNISSLGFGTASAQMVALSQWVYSSISGTFTGVITNGSANNREWLWTCALTAATWTKCARVIPGDTAGTWTLSGTAEAMKVQWTLAAGSSLVTSQTDQWRASAGFYGGTGQTSLTETNGATFQLSNVKLEVAKIPSPFVMPLMADDLARAQRYYAKTFPQGTAVAQNAGLAGALSAVGVSTTAGTIVANWRFPVPMRCSPTIVTYNPSAANANWRNVTDAADAVVSVDPNTAKGSTGVEITEVTTALVVASRYYIHATANCRL